MSLGQYLTGAAFFVPTIGACLFAARLTVRRQFSDQPPLPRALAYMVLSTAAVVFAHVIPAALTVLSRVSALSTAVLLCVLAANVPAARSRPSAGPPAPRPRSGSGPSIAIAVVAVVAVTVYELARLRTLATQPLTDIDMLGFHLPGVARFIQTGTLWQIDQFLPGFATAQYPNDGDFLLLSAVLPWHSLAFVRFVPLPFYAFTAVGAYAIAIELRATRAAAATLAAAVIPIPAISLLALDGLPDVVSLATMAAGVVFLIRHARSGQTSELALAGLALGLALGTKWYGLTAVAAVVPAWLIGRVSYRRVRGKVTFDLAILLGMMLLGGGIWLVRNLVESGNPVYPKAVKLLSLQLFGGSAGDIIDRYGYTIADYLGKPHVLDAYIFPGFRERVGLTGAVLLFGVMIASAAALGRSRRPAGSQPLERLVLGCAIVVVAMTAIYTVTPGSAYGLRDAPAEAFVNIRWLMPAAILAAALSARAVATLGPAGPVLELAALLGTLESIRLGSGVALTTVVKLVALLAALAALWLAGARLARSGRVSVAHRGLFLPSLLTAIAVALLSGRALQQAFDQHSYAGYDPTFAWIDAHAPDRHRVGIAGIASTTGLSPVLPAFGPALGNEVGYVGQWVRHSLHVISNERRFRRQLLAGRYDLLLVGLQDPGDADMWARGAGYRLVARSSRLALFQAPSAAGQASRR